MSARDGAAGEMLVGAATRGAAQARWGAAAALAAAGLVVAATLARVGWFVWEAASPCPACAESDLPDLGPAVAALGTVYGLVYAGLALLAAWGLARTLRRPGYPWSGLLAVVAASLALVLVHALEGRFTEPFFLLNAAAWLLVVALAARGAGRPSSPGSPP